MATILVVDDEPQILTALQRGLTRVGHDIAAAQTAQDGLDAAVVRRPDLVLLDLRLPDLDGIEVVRRLRSWTDVPILLLSGNGTERARVDALDAGADDFVDKPFSMHELRARVGAALRRSAATEAAVSGSPVMRHGEVHIDLGHRKVTVRGQAVRLTPIQWKLLEVLARNSGRLLTYRYIIERVWSEQHGDEARESLRAHMRTLRRKLGDDATAPRCIETELGVGYRWIAESGA